MGEVTGTTCCGVDVYTLIDDLNSYRNPVVSGLNAERVLNVLLDSKDMSALSATYVPIASIKSDLKQLKQCNRCREDNDVLSHCGGRIRCTVVHEQIARDIDMLVNRPDKYPVIKTKRHDDAPDAATYFKAMLEYSDATNDPHKISTPPTINPKLYEPTYFTVGRGTGKTMSCLMEELNEAYSIVVRDFAKTALAINVKSIEQSADHRTVVVIWTDGSKTIVKRSENDPDDIYMAFTAALAKKIYGSNSAIKREIGKKLNEHKAKEKKNEQVDV